MKYYNCSNLSRSPSAVQEEKAHAFEPFLKEVANQNFVNQFYDDFSIVNKSSPRR